MRIAGTINLCPDIYDGITFSFITSNIMGEKMTNKEQAIADEDCIKRAIAIRDLLMEVKDKTGAMMEEIDETQRKTLPRELITVLTVPPGHLYVTIELLLNLMGVELSKIRQDAAD